MWIFIIYATIIKTKVESNPTKKPAYTCLGVCACNVSLANAVNPAASTIKQNHINKFWCRIKDRASTEPAKPPKPIKCALIFHLRLMIAVSIMPIAAANKKEI